MNWKTQAVPAGCLEAAGALNPLPCLQDFYLAGGTALALLYGHRFSVDLDFFSSVNTLTFSGRQEVREGLLSVGAVIEEEKDGTIHARLKDTHLSFFRYSYPLLRPVKRWGRLQVAHPVDIGLMKLGAIIGRGSKKDFMDLYVILKNEISLPRLLRLASKKFHGSRDFRMQALRALVYFTDADTEPDLALLEPSAKKAGGLSRPLPWHTVKRYIESEVRGLARSFR